MSADGNALPYEAPSVEPIETDGETISTAPGTTLKPVG
jgi:hypothetical protein